MAAPKFLGVLFLLLGTEQCFGYFNFQSQLPNENNVNHPCKANYKWGGVGHKNPLGGGDRNEFGIAFQNAGYQWTPELCFADSDGDGMTNGQELGDPNCVWSQGRIPDRTTDITNPGVCEPINAPQCVGKTNCQL